MTHAIVLLSGGLDSALCLRHARLDHAEVTALCFDYGQRHRAEIEAARRIASAEGVQLVVHRLDLCAIGGSSLTGGESVAGDGPSTYVPARNTVFLAVALAYAETLRARLIYVGANADDRAGYPDCRPEYLRAFEAMASLATHAGPVEIRAPLLGMTKADIVRRVLAMRIDPRETVTCYQATPDGIACGECGSCILRIDAFRAIGSRDPARYQGDRS